MRGIEKTVDRSRRVTRNDVAKLAGVSPAVVSYVVNKSKYVSPEKTQAVEKAIEQLQYRPNMQARGLKTNRSMQIAFVCDNLRNDWLEEAEKLLFEKGYYVSHCYSKDGEEYIQMLISRQFDGIFMMSNRFSTAQLNEIADAGIPIVLYKTRKYGELRPNIATVAPDYRDAVEKCVNYLAMRGHKRIALIPPIRYKTSGIYSDGFRIKAFINAMEKNGLEVKENLICTDTKTLDSILAHIFSIVVGTPEERPTAFITGNDYMAVQIMGYLKKLGLRVPEDAAVIGCDNTYLSMAATPLLTSVDFSKAEFSKKLANTMLELINGEKIEPTQYIKVSIVIRESA